MARDPFQLTFDFTSLITIDRHRIILAYDTPCNRRRRHFAKIALGYTQRIQKSVYEADLTDVQARIMTKALMRIADPVEDDIRIYPQCSRCAAMCSMLGKAMPIASPRLVVA